MVVENERITTVQDLPTMTNYVSIRSRDHVLWMDELSKQHREANNRLKYLFKLGSVLLLVHCVIIFLFLRINFV